MSNKGVGLSYLTAYVFSDDSELDDEDGDAIDYSTYSSDFMSSSSVDGDDKSTSATDTCSCRSDVSPKYTLSDFDDDFEKLLPPLTTEAYPAELQQKLDALTEKANAGLNINLFIQTRKEFHNPSMLDKLIEHCGIYEYGTNLRPNVFDPDKWGPGSYYERLGDIQIKNMHRLAKRRAALALAPIPAAVSQPTRDVSVQIISGTTKRNSTEDHSKTQDIAAKVAHAKKVTDAIVAKNCSDSSDNNIFVENSGQTMNVGVVYDATKGQYQINRAPQASRLIPGKKAPINTRRTELYLRKNHFHPSTKVKSSERPASKTELVLRRNAKHEPKLEGGNGNSGRKNDQQQQLRPSKYQA
ncbi:hypothetical protein TSAR_010537 [Trichomalopsis sarcophagae]|uniref:SAP30-binding protein n=1 Tax=Trichomalopsis sarcophagae TaxID=543379 RepID=A0A232F5W1_9HYME|nr:hypothetical protein TSAR_010537 [Trichomalopsis sarcophagae]